MYIFTDTYAQLSACHQSWQERRNNKTWIKKQESFISVQTVCWRWHHKQQHHLIDPSHFNLFTWNWNRIPFYFCRFSRYKKVNFVFFFVYPLSLNHRTRFICFCVVGLMYVCVCLCLFCICSMLYPQTSIIFIFILTMFPLFSPTIVWLCSTKIEEKKGNKEQERKNEMEKNLFLVHDFLIFSRNIFQDDFYGTSNFFSNKKKYINNSSESDTARYHRTKW